MRSIFLGPAVWILAIAGCDRDQPAAPAEPLATGYWQASIELPGGTVDTAIEISRKGGIYQATLLNGQERIPIGKVAMTDGNLQLRFPAFDNEINARLEDGKLVGELSLLRPHGATETMPFSAKRGREPVETEASKTAGEDMSGRWSAVFRNPDGSRFVAIGDFAQRGTRLFGTFLTPYGDFRYLSGRLRGKNFKLSSFDGSQAMIFTGQLGANEISDGAFWNGTSWHQKWTARRTPGTPAPDIAARTSLKPGYENIEFALPNVAGEQVSLQDERYLDRVVLVMLLGTWSANSHDLARVVGPLYRQYAGQGFEAIGLMYEHSRDERIALRQIAEFRSKFDIQFETLFAGNSDKTSASASLPALTGVEAYPTLIFVDRSGRVRKILTGFYGPATGQAHSRLQKEIVSLISALLKEPQPAAEKEEPVVTDVAN